MEPIKDTQFMDKVHQKATRKIKAQKQAQSHVWLGLGMIGIVGWSVTIPTLAGLALGLWLDKSFPGAYVWTLNLLLLGLIIGCVIAWRWVSKEYNAMNKNERSKNGD
ncbi:MAG: AtpZ/AtpI family protein [Gammaproteobacteria bacterium]|nr:AtpZ/AtpI family protein [Gammaproteobacteria bacterium]